jgi:hypothetical protein
MLRREAMWGLVRKWMCVGCIICGLVLAVTSPGLAGVVRDAVATGVSRNGLLVLANEHGVWTVDEHGGGRHLVFTDSPCAPAQPSAAFSSDGRTLAVVSYNPCRAHSESSPGAIQLTLITMNGLRRRDAVTVPANPRVVYQTFDGPQFTPDGKTVAYAVGPTAVSAGSQYTSHVVLVDVRSGRPRLIISVLSRTAPLKLEAATSGLPFAFSPDGREIAYVPPDSVRIVLASAETGRLVRTIRTAGGEPNGLAWGANGSLAYAAADGSIYETDSAGSTVKRLRGPSLTGLSGSETDIGPQFSPDGTSLMYQRLIFGPSGPDSGAGVNVTTYTQITPTNGGRSDAPWSDGSGNWQSAAWSGDSDWIATNGPRGVYIVSASSGQGRRIAGLFGTVLAWQALPSP